MAKRMRIFRCIICDEFSFEVICKSCEEKFLKPKINKKGDILSFYDYEEIEFLIKYKYNKFGHRVFKILAKPFYSFAKEIKENFFVIPIDDNPKKGFSHTAILANEMKSKHLKILFNSLLATNNVKYAGKTLEFRLNNPKNFIYKGKKDIDAILVDDIVTTKTTLNQAKEVLKKHNVNVVLSVVLANLSK